MPDHEACIEARRPHQPSAILEPKEVYGRIYRTIDEAKSAIGSFSDDVNNTQRLHSALNCQAPVVFEASRATDCV